MKTKTQQVPHGVTSTGPQRAIDINRRMREIEQAAKAEGAREVFVVFGPQGSFIVHTLTGQA